MYVISDQQPMERSKIENSIIEIFNDVFEIKDIVINDELSQKECWRIGIL